MKIELNNEIYNLEINKKNSTKNIYMRVRDDLTIYVTSNTFTSNQRIMEAINKNKDYIFKMIERVKKKQEKNNSDKLFYLGKEYDIVYLNTSNISFSNERVYVNRDFDINKWYRKEAGNIFKKELDSIYQIYPHKIPYPSLMIRNMKTRWGVCNTKLKKITLNLSLIKMDTKYLDYVIVHELSHLIEANHSKAFWALVEECMPDYKKIRKELKDE